MPTADLAFTPADEPDAGAGRASARPARRACQEATAPLEAAGSHPAPRQPGAVPVGPELEQVVARQGEHRAVVPDAVAIVALGEDQVRQSRSSAGRARARAAPARRRRRSGARVLRRRPRGRRRAAARRRRSRDPRRRAAPGHRGRVDDLGMIATLLLQAGQPAGQGWVAQRKARPRATAHRHRDVEAHGRRQLDDAHPRADDHAVGARSSEVSTTAGSPGSTRNT